MTIRYYYVLASRDFLLHQEAVEEILRERSQYYLAKSLKKGYALLDAEDFKDYLPTHLAPLNQFMLIVSTDATWIDWLKLRLQYVYKSYFDTDQPILKPKHKSYPI